MISKCLHKALVENWAMGQNWANLGKFLGKLGQIFGQNWANWAKLPHSLSSLSEVHARSQTSVVCGNRLAWKLSSLLLKKPNTEIQDGGAAEGRPTILTVCFLGLGPGFHSWAPFTARNFQTSLLPQTTDVRNRMQASS